MQNLFRITLRIVLFLSGAALAATKLMATGHTPGAMTPASWQIDRMTCEYRLDPLGIDELHPRLSWTFSSGRRNEYQSSYRIVVASTEEMLEKNIGDCWDSGIVPSAENINAEYNGKPLKSHTRYFWKIKAWDQSGSESPWSKAGWWETALLDPAGWKGTWIGTGKPAPDRDEDFYQTRPAPFFRKGFRLQKKIGSARLYISGLGYYEAYLNGKKIGDQVLDPGWTNYARTVLYSVYDITSGLRQGSNAIGILLGNGWYDPLPLKLFGAFNFRKILTIGQPRVIANIRIQFSDGSTQVIGTDGSWKTGDSYILKNNIYLGEEQDGRLASVSWSLPGWKDEKYASAVSMSAPGGEMKVQAAPPIRITKIFQAASISTPAAGVYVFDLGQNFAGWIRMKIRGQRGQQLHFRYGEILYPDGRVNGMTAVAGHIKEIWHLKGGPGSPATAYQEDTYTCSGETGEQFQPHFTFHVFRYVEVTGLLALPSPESLEGLRLNADLRQTGHFTCSNPMLNKIQEMTLSSFLSNVFSVQSDCPGRERQGYGADMVVSAEAFAVNYDMSTFYAKTIEDFANDTRPNGAMPECAPYNGIATEGFEDGAGPLDWQLAFSFLQEKLYRFYGNKKILQDQYARTRNMVEFLRGQSRDHLIDHGIGDHVAVNPKHVPLTSGAFYFHHAQLLTEIAHILGRKEDSAIYRGLADSVRDSFNRRYLETSTGAYDTAHNETTQVFPLWYGLAPRQEQEKVFALLLDEIQKNGGHLSTGIFGTKMLFDVLRRKDRNDIAYTINMQTTYPGYGYMLGNGASTLWETWEKPEQNSWNHPMFGSVSEWFYRSLAGINPAEDACGMDNLIIKPFTGGDLRSVKSDFASVRGNILSEWEKKEGILEWRLSIPPNTRAVLYIPAPGIKNISESEKPVTDCKDLIFQGMENGYAIFNVVSGEYHFTVR